MKSCLRLRDHVLIFAFLFAFLCALCWLHAGGVVFQSPSGSDRNVDAPAKPNILLILADDMGYSDLGCYGGEIANPNLAQGTGGINGSGFDLYLNKADADFTKAKPIGKFMAASTFGAGNPSLMSPCIFEENGALYL